MSPIANLKAGGGGAARTTQCKYRSCRDSIRTQILNFSKSRRNRKMERRSGYNPTKKCRVYVQSGEQPRQDQAWRVFGRVRNRTELVCTSKPGPLPGYPDPLLTLDCRSDLKLSTSTWAFNLPQLWIWCMNHCSSSLLNCTRFHLLQHSIFCFTTLKNQKEKGSDSNIDRGTRKQYPTKRSNNFNQIYTQWHQVCPLSRQGE